MYSYAVTRINLNYLLGFTLTTDRVTANVSNVLTGENYLLVFDDNF